MDEYMQFSAKTKNEAITKACIELGVSSDQLDIQVVSEGSSGFFGIGSKPAIIKARKVDDNSEEKEIEKSRECDLWPAFSGCDWSMLPDEQLVGCMATVPG